MKKKKNENKENPYLQNEVNTTSISRNARDYETPGEAKFPDRGVSKRGERIGLGEEWAQVLGRKKKRCVWETKGQWN